MAWINFFGDKVRIKDIFLRNGRCLADVFYPVGSIYISAASTSPADMFGGTWKKINGRYLLAAGDDVYVPLTSEGSYFTLNKRNRVRWGVTIRGYTRTWMQARTRQRTKHLTTKTQRLDIRRKYGQEPRSDLNMVPWPRA